ncbi:MAG TPA: hypothetical protein EYG21_04505 [Nitrospinaceae bacterium]|jgi:hypothetical protein|nr:hypothetical protein [Nitrospinaceae bacterium]
MELIIIGLLIIIVLILWLRNKKLGDATKRLNQDLEDYKQSQYWKQSQNLDKVNCEIVRLEEKVTDLRVHIGLDKEDPKPIQFKINDSENGSLSPEVLQIDGGSYVDGMPDYEWFFSVASEDFPALYKALTGETELPNDVADGLKQYLQENGTTVTQLKEVCEANDIEHSFSNYM